MRPLIVARTTSPLSHLTRNMAFGSASWTTPSNSSLSPLGSLRSRLSTMQRGISEFLCSPTERAQHARGHLFDTTHPVDDPKDAHFLVVRKKLRSHRLVGVEAFGHDILVIVRPMFEVRF